MNQFRLYARRITLLSILALLIFQATSLFAEKDIEIGKDFTLFTSKNLAGFTKPLFTSVEESMNSNIFTQAIYPKHWTIGLDISVMGMFIPDEQTTFNAERPDMYGNQSVTRTAELRNGVILKNYTADNIQPTIYGGSSNGIYSAPQSYYNVDGVDPQNYKSVAYVEGNNISFMSGLPIIQLIVGFPTRTQLRLRALPIDMQGETLLYLGFLLNQQVDHFFDLFKKEDMMGIALNASYHSLSRTNGIDISSFSFGAHFSKGWDNGLSVYGGFQIEDLSGKFEAVREQANPNDVQNSPYEEVRLQKNLKFDIENFNKWRLLAGFAYRTGIIELHGDAAWASQPILTCGISFYLGEFGKEEEEIKIEKYEKIERYEKIEKIEKK